MTSSEYRRLIYLNAFAATPREEEERERLMKRLALEETWLDA